MDFSLMVTNLTKNLRIRDLKNALNEQGVKPSKITWIRYKGICYLYYAKAKPTTNNENKNPLIVDNVIQILQNLKINPEHETELCVKIMEPISRIETTNITAV